MRRLTLEIMGIFVVAVGFMNVPAFGAEPTAPAAVVAPAPAIVADADYQEVPFAKLFNPGFAGDFNGKKVKIVVQWIGVATAMMHMSAGFAPYNNGQWVEVGITVLGDTKAAFGQYAQAKWNLYIPKKDSDPAFNLVDGEKVTLYVACKMQNFSSMLGGNSGLSNLVLVIDKIEKTK